MNNLTKRLFLSLVICGAPLLQNRVKAEGPADGAQPVVAKYVGVYRKPPGTVGELDPSIKACRIPDGPLMGNGDMAVAVGGTATTQTFYVSKSDMSHSARGVGGLTISFAARAGDIAMYRQEQDLFRSETRSTIPLQAATIRMRSWTADADNLLVTDVSAEGQAPVGVTLTLWAHKDRAATQAGAENGVIWSTREIGGTVGADRQPFSSKVALATRVFGAEPTCATDGKTASTATFTLPAGKTIRIVTVGAGGYGIEDHVKRANVAIAALTPQSIDERLSAHIQWWKRYWDKSQVELGDDLLERYYYGALYVLGCSSRAGSNPPGLAGPWHLHGPACWSNKYTLDYNFMAVWWGVYSSNRPELADPYYDVILKLIPAGKQLASENGTKGVLFAVNAHAWGGFTDTRTLNMKSNASLACLNFMMHYNYTQDESFLVQKAWPLLKELAVFWEDNLEWDAAGSRWMISNSGAREGGKDTNAINDLSYVNALFRFLLSTSDTLEGKQSGGQIIHITDAQKAKWRSYVSNLSQYPTIELSGKTVFKEAENRSKMCLGGPGDNSDVLNAVFPAEAISLGSDPQLLQIARNTVAALNPDTGKASWFQANSFPKIYTQAVRSGYPADKVVANLKLLLAGRQPYDDRGDHVQLRNNLTIVPPVHSLESVGAVEAINSMLLQSHDNTLRVFPVWMKDKDVSFRDLRACGAFLVSSEYKNGRATHIDIKSEVGRACKIQSPWVGNTVEVLSLSGGQPEKVVFQLEGNVISFSTENGKHYRIRP